ncbi:FCD domain-containing protein [Streptomyces sp. NPDC002205]|uniref:FCD domain-containing protein n=1 Tax=Streptomyces sp. NPDC002205 TaxID=3154411 RepID=UPI003321AAB2
MGTGRSFDLAFHHEIARMADNGILELVLESLSDVLAAHRLASYEGRPRRGDSQQATITAHRRILDASRRVIRRRPSQPGQEDTHHHSRPDQALLAASFTPSRRPARTPQCLKGQGDSLRVGQKPRKLLP